MNLARKVTFTRRENTKAVQIEFSSPVGSCEIMESHLAQLANNRVANDRRKTSGYHEFQYTKEKFKNPSILRH